MGKSNTSDNIQINNKMPNPSQEPSVSSKAPNEDLNDKYALCTFKLKIESQNLDHGCKNVNIKIKMPNPSQESPVIQMGLGFLFIMSLGFYLTVICHQTCSQRVLLLDLTPHPWAPWLCCSTCASVSL